MTLKLLRLLSVRMDIEIPERCPNCHAGPESMTWDGIPKAGSVMAGERGLVVAIWLGCDECSETLLTTDLDRFLMSVNYRPEISSTRPAPVSATP